MEKIADLRKLPVILIYRFLLNKQKAQTRMKMNLGGTIHLVVQGMCVSSLLDRRKSIMVMEFEICSADYIHHPNMYKVA